MNYRSVNVDGCIAVALAFSLGACGSTSLPEVPDETTDDSGGSTAAFSTGATTNSSDPNTGPGPDPDSTTSADSGGETGTDSDSGSGPGIECRAPMILCGDTCVETTNNLDHCGDCDVVCAPAANSTPVCMDRGCDVECTAGFDNCDGDPKNGCESDLANDPDNCGGCGVAGIEVCDSMESDCDGVPDNGCPGGVDVAASDFGLHLQFGNLVGGDEFSDACPAGSAIHGISGNVGGNIDRLRFDCAAVELTIDDSVVPHIYSITSGLTTTLPTYGSNVTTPFAEQCGVNQFVVGIDGEASPGGLHDLTIHCAALEVSGDIGSFSLTYGPVTTLSVDGDGSGGVFSDLLVAPALVTSVRGRAGAWVDAIGVGESDVSLVIN